MKKLCLLALAGAMVVSLGCAKRDQTPKNQFSEDLKDAPEWVMKECAAFSGEKGQMLCGLGQMEGTNNMSLCRTAAKERARTALARDFETSVRALFKSYQANIGDVAGAGEDEQKVVDAAIQLTKTKLRGTRLVDQWISPAGRCFALIALDSKAFTNNLRQMEQLSAEVREKIEKHAEETWDELVEATK